MPIFRIYYVGVFALKWFDFSYVGSGLFFGKLPHIQNAQIELESRRLNEKLNLAQVEWNLYSRYIQSSNLLELHIPFVNNNECL